MADGKSNAEIAAGTAKQHVERILAKRGVENRTAAAAFARDHGIVVRRQSRRDSTPPRRRHVLERRNLSVVVVDRRVLWR